MTMIDRRSFFKITAFGAVFNGDPAGPGEGDPQLRDNHGLAFRVNDPPWVIGQVRFDYDIDIGGRSLPGNFTPGATIAPPASFQLGGQTTSGVGINIETYAVGDLNGDGKIDLVFDNPGANGNFSCYRNTGSPGPACGATHPTGSGPRPPCARRSSSA